MDDSATAAWIVHRDNTVQRAPNLQWIPSPDSLPSIASVELIQPLAEHETALGVGGNTLVRYENGIWTVVDSLPEWSTSAWASRDGRVVWAVSFDGLIMQWREGEWRVDTLPPALADTKLYGPIAMEEDGSTGWVGSSRGLLRIRAGHASIGFKPARGIVHTYAMSADGSVGWAIINEFDNASVARYEGGVWRMAGAEAAPLRVSKPDSIVGLWLDKHGTHGWAVSARGVLIRFENGTWQRERIVWTPTTDEVVGLWMNPAGTRGVVYGRRGTLDRLRDGRWSPAQLGGTIRNALTSHDLRAIWMSAEGVLGWAVGDHGAVVRHVDGRWLKDSIPGADDSFFRAVAMDQQGRTGWAVGLDGVTARYDSARWKAHAPLASAHLYDVWTSRDGTVAFAVGSGATLLHYRHGEWQQLSFPPSVLDSGIGNLVGIEVAEGMRRMFLRTAEGRVIEVPLTDSISARVSEARLTEEPGNVLWLDVSDSTGTKVVVVGEFATRTVIMQQLEHGHWVQRPSPVSELSSSGLQVYALEVGPQGNGLLIGRSSLDNFIAPRRNGRWIDPVEIRSFFPRGLEPRAAWIARSARHSWVVGDVGYIAEVSAVTARRIHLRPLPGTQINAVVGSFVVEGLSGEGAAISSVQIGRTGRERFVLAAGDRDWSVTGGRLTLSQGFADRVTKTFLNEPVVIRMTVIHPGTIPGGAIEYESEGFYVLGRPWWHRVLLTIGGVLVINAVLVVFSVWSSRLRRVILDPVGSHLVGLVVGKYLIIDALIKHVEPVKMALLRDYRRRLRESPALVYWESHEYIPPAIRFGEQPLDENGGEPAWIAAFEHLTQVEGRRLWLVEGVSGLGKSALLERWASLALRHGRTPLLVRLGSGRPLAEEMATLFAQFGDLHVSPEVAASLVEGGGFVVLLDGLNEDQAPETTRVLVRRIIARNLVVLTSQYDPGWQKDVLVGRIALEPFGRAQLLCLMASEYVDQAMAAPQLNNVLRLPQTAQLASSYVKRNQQLPTMSVYLYADLRSQLSTGAEILNFDFISWSLFRVNDTYFPVDNGLGAGALERAAALGIVTRAVRDGKPRFRFAHERIHRYFVACYLAAQDQRPLSKWHSELREGLGRLYWMDVLDLWAESIAAAVHENAASGAEYQDFLQHVAEFSEPVFRRLYAQAGRMHASGLLRLDEGFVRWAADLMANARSN